MRVLSSSVSGKFQFHFLCHPCKTGSWAGNRNNGPNIGLARASIGLSDISDNGRVTVGKGHGEAEEAGQSYDEVCDMFVRRSLEKYSDHDGTA